MFLSFMWPQVPLLFLLKCMINLTKTNLIKFWNVLLIKYLGVHLHLYLKVVSGVSVHEWISFEWECLYSCKDIQSQKYSQPFWKKQTNPQTNKQCWTALFCSLDKVRTPHKKNTSFNVFTCILASEDKDVYAFRVSWRNYSDIDPEDERLCNDHPKPSIVQDLHTVFTYT